MHICVTMTEKDGVELVDPRFGRCEQFGFVDTESGALEREPNALTMGAGGVGAKVGQLLADRGVQAVITGQVGPNAFRVLSAAGIDVYTVNGGTVEEAITAFKEGRLTPVSAPTGPARHAGH